MKIKMIREKISEISPYDFEGPESNADSVIREIALKHPNHSDFTLSWTGLGDGYFDLYGIRQETEKERTSRLRKFKKEKERKSREKEQIIKEELAEYERLKRKFA